MRRVLLQIHLWLGITIGLLWALQGLTGAVLVFHREIDRIAGPVVSSGPMAPIDAILENATKAAGGARIVRLSITDQRRDLLDASYVDEANQLRAVRIDAATAQVVGTRDMEPLTPFSGSVTRWVLMLHMKLLSGRSGEVFIGISGLVLFTSVVIGLWLAWPPRLAWKTVYSWHRWRTSLQRLYGWHRAIGLTVAVIVLTIALTGVCMTFEEQLRPRAVRPMPLQSQGAVISPHTALGIAQRRFPEASWVRISMPTARSPAYTIRFHQRDEIREWLGKTTVVVDASSGRIESVYDPTIAPLSNRMIDAAWPVHTGELLGTGGRILMLLTGLALPTLYVTGVWRWLGRHRQRLQILKRTNGH